MAAKVESTEEVKPVKEKVVKDSSLNEEGFKAGEPIDMNEYFAFIAKQRNK